MKPRYVNRSKNSLLKFRTRTEDFLPFGSTHTPNFSDPNQLTIWWWRTHEQVNAGVGFPSQVFQNKQWKNQAQDIDRKQSHVYFDKKLSPITSTSTKSLRVITKKICTRD